MYCIYQKTNSIDSITDIIYQPDTFLAIVKSKKIKLNDLFLDDIYINKGYSILENISLDNIAKYDCFGYECFYLVVNKDEIYLIYKDKVQTKDTFLNKLKYCIFSEESIVRILYQWKLIKFDVCTERTEFTPCEDITESFEQPEQLEQLEQLELSEFPKLDMKSVIDDGSVVLICGKRGTGKTTLIKHIIDTHLQSVTENQNTLIILGTKMNNSYANYTDSKIIYAFDHDLFLEYAKKEGGLIVLDDCFHSNSTRYIRELLDICRQFNKTVLLTRLYSDDVYRWCDYCMFFRENSVLHQQKISKIFYMLGSHFNKYFDTFTKDYSLLCTDGCTAFYYSY